MAMIRQYMTAGDTPRWVKFKRTASQKRKALQVGLVLHQLRARSGPRRLGGRMRGFAAAGDPFRLRLPKFIRKLQPGKILAKAAPILGSLALPGLGTLAGGLVSRLGGAAGKVADVAQQLAPAFAPPSTLTGPGAPSQDYHDQYPTIPGITVTPETSGRVYRQDDTESDDSDQDDSDQDDGDQTTDEQLLNDLLALLQ